MLKIYNTLTRKKEAFKPIENGHVKIYVCGPTVYDSCHIGHARSVVVFDVIVRYLRAVGYRVTYVRNFTDIDDKIINRANKLGLSTNEVAERYIREFYEDMDALKVERANYEPRATAHMPDIIDVIQRLFDRGHAYQSGGDVFFAVDTAPAYGRLSGRRLEDMQAGARVEVDGRKRNPLDFVLWKGAKPAEPFWESPWGIGRPGWHIECSAMSTRLLGRHFDIHGGGEDLVFPHNENEIAQSEGAFGSPFVRVWIHNGFVKINQEKMSKSLGNFLTVKEILKRYHPEAVRLFLLANHYRSPVDFTDQAMAEAQTGLEKIYSLLERLEHLPLDKASGGQAGSGELWAGCCDALDDDFNSARAVGLIFDAVRQSNRTMDEQEGVPTGQTAEMLAVVRADLARVAAVLGIGTERPEEFFEKIRNLKLQRSSVDSAHVERLIAERADARRRKDWARADEIRKTLADMSVILEDRPDGTIWKVS